MSDDVTVVIGVGGMGNAIARRIGSGRTLVLADIDEQSLRLTADALREDGYEVRAIRVDVADGESVSMLAQRASREGPVTHVVHTAGLSPVQATPEAILRVDLLGVAIVLDAFEHVVAAGGACVVIASIAGHLASHLLTQEMERALASTPSEDLLALPFLSSSLVSDPGAAYAVAKRGNILRVRAAAVSWGVRRARVNSISPGIIATAMGHAELSGPRGEVMRGMVEASAIRRFGTPDEIAAAVTFLIGPDASFITGSDLLVDGGVLAAAAGAVSG